MMVNRIGFSWYVGQQLASLLPYRKKGWVFGTKGCEWAAVVPMIKAAFSLGCSLALANKSAAEEILAEAAISDALENRGQPWRTAFSRQIQYLETKCRQNQSADRTTFEDFYPDLRSGGYYTSDRFKELFLTPEECAVRVGQWVAPGMICGILFAETASSMLETWVTQKSGWRDLGTGGLRVDESPLLTSVEQAYERAQSLYEAWQKQ